MGVKKRTGKLKKRSRRQNDRAASNNTNRTETVIRLAWTNEAKHRQVKRGRRTAEDDELIANRDHLAHELETYWGSIGWELKCARTPEEIHAAFRAIAAKNAHYLLNPFLRHTAEAANRESLRETRNRYNEASSQLDDVEQKQRHANEALKEAKGAGFELSRVHQKALEREVEFRKTSLRNLTIQLTNLKGQIKAIKLKIDKIKPDDRQSLQPQLDSLEREALHKLETETSGEQQILSQVKDRLGAITPERKKIAATIIRTRRAKAREVNKTLYDVNAEYRALREKLLDREAYYFRTELLRFIRLERNKRTGLLTRRYGYNPRNLANAIAGLPTMNCRRSAARLAKHPYTWEPHTIYKIVEFLEQLQRERVFSLPKAASEIVALRINGLPKSEPIPKNYTNLTDKKRRENFLRRHLQENWPFLKPAIEYSVTSAKHTGQLPYLITAKFQDNLAKPRTQADILFAEKDKLTD